MTANLKHLLNIERVSHKDINLKQPFNAFVPNAPFLYPLKISENLTVFWYFQGVGKGCIGNEWVKTKLSSLKLMLSHKKQGLQIDTSQTTVWNKVLNFLKNKLTETATRGVPQKKVFLEILQYSKEYTYFWVSF